MALVLYLHLIALCYIVLLVLYCIKKQLEI